ncbi:hypothetical protein [Maribacter arcticus]|uniref:hypothetical protein n=1 Tax=Maribacter arcticus TaxID=561365 RepID=UPI0030031207
MSRILIFFFFKEFNFSKMRDYRSMLLVISTLFLSNCSGEKKPTPEEILPPSIYWLEHFQGDVKSVSLTGNNNTLGDYDQLENSEPFFMNERYFNGSGQLTSKKEWGDYETKYFYDSLGRLIRTEIESKDGPWKTEEIKYNDDGNILDFREYSANPKQLEEIHKYNYSNNGKEIKINKYKVKEDKPEKNGYDIYKYDKNNHLVEHEQYLKAYEGDGLYYEFIVLDVISNDDFGNPLEVKTIFFNQFRESPREPNFEYYKYQYDEKGNWTKKTKTKSDMELLLEQEERTIEYY